MMHDLEQITQPAAAEENDNLISETLGAIPISRPTCIKDTGQGHFSNQPHAAGILKAPTKIGHKSGRRYTRCKPCFCFCKVAKLHSTNFKLPAIDKQDRTTFREEILQSHLKIKRPLKQ